MCSGPGGASEIWDEDTDLLQSVPGCCCCCCCTRHYFALPPQLVLVVSCLCRASSQCPGSLLSVQAARECSGAGLTSAPHGWAQEARFHNNAVVFRFKTVRGVARSQCQDRLRIVFKHIDCSLIFFISRFNINFRIDNDEEFSSHAVLNLKLQTLQQQHKTI